MTEKPSPYWDKPLPITNYLEELSSEELAALQERYRVYMEQLNSYSKEKELFPLKFVKSYLYKTLCDKFGKVLCDKEDARVFALICQYFAGSEEFTKTTMSNGRLGDLSKGLYITGNVGIGKTELILPFRRMITGYPANYFNNGYEMYATANQIAAAYDKQGEDGIASYISTKTLFIDDLGREPQSKYYGKTVEALELIFSGRYDLGKREKVVTHVTTNIIDAELIEERYGDYIRSRFKELFNKVHWQGKEKR